MAGRVRYRCSPDHDMIEIPGVGFVQYAWLERQAICIESGMSEREALRVASTDYQAQMRPGLAKAGSSYPESIGVFKSAK